MRIIALLLGLLLAVGTAQAQSVGGTGKGNNPFPPVSYSGSGPPVVGQCAIWVGGLFVTTGVCGGGGTTIAIEAGSPLTVAPTSPCSSGLCTLGITPVCADSTGLALWPSCNQTWGLSQRGSQGSVTPSGSTFTPDFNANQHFLYTLENGSNTIANPTNLSSAKGQVGLFEITQPSSGAAGTVTWDTSYVTQDGVASLTLSSTNGAVDYLPYYVTFSGAVLLGVGAINAVH